MELGKFLKVFEKGFRDFYRNPSILLPGIGMWLFITVFSLVVKNIRYVPSNNLETQAWLIFFGLVTVVAFAFLFAGFIGMAGRIIGDNKKRGGFFDTSLKYWFRNIIIMFVIMAVSILVGRIAHYGATYIGKGLGLEIGVAQVIFVLIYFAGLIGVLMFLTFASFFLVLEDRSVLGSIRRSFRFVKREYLTTLVLSIVLYIVFKLLTFVPGLAGEIIEYWIVLPFMALLLTRFVIEYRK